VSIKKKLIFILAVMSLLLFLIAGYLLWNVVQASREMERIGRDIDYLHDMGGLRVLSYNQSHLLMHYFYFYEDRVLQELFAADNDINGLISKLRDEGAAGRNAAVAQPGLREDQRDREHLRLIENEYKQIAERVRHAIDLRKEGKPERALKFITGTVDQQIDEVFLKDVDDAINDKNDELMAAYDRILMHMGALPRVGGSRLQLIQGTRYSIQYYLAVDRLSLALHRELNEIIQYIATGHMTDLAGYREAGADIERALQECVTIIRTQEAIGMEGKQGQEGEVNDLRQEYHKLSALMQQAYKLKRAGRDYEAFQLTDSGLKHAADNLVLPKLERIMVNSRAEIMLDHRILMRSIYISGSLSVFVIAAVAIVLLVVVYRLIMRMMRAIHALDRGAEIIGSGDLDHRIAVYSSDELGELAGSFNKMAAYLKDSNDDLRSFIFSLSHDLRTPLVNIKGFSEELITGISELGPILEKYLEGFPAEEQRRYGDVLKKEIPDALKYIGSSINQMDKLINAVLALSRIGHRELKPERIDMDLVVRSALESFAHRIAHDKVSVTIGPLPVVIADRLVMEQCINNLIDNAIKYLDPSRPGTVELSAEWVDEETVFRVRDNGRGIAEHDLPKIFGLFRRAGQQDVPGEGLGLAYVKALVKRQGGRIWCESAFGIGTTFWFTVPDRAPANRSTVG